MDTEERREGRGLRSRAHACPKPGDRGRVQPAAGKGAAEICASGIQQMEQKGGEKRARRPCRRERVAGTASGPGRKQRKEGALLPRDSCLCGLFT